MDRWSDLVAPNGLLHKGHLEKVILNEDVLKGGSLEILDEERKKQLTRDYLQVKLKFDEKPMEQDTPALEESQYQKPPQFIEVPQNSRERHVGVLKNDAEVSVMAALTCGKNPKFYYNADSKKFQAEKTVTRYFEVFFNDGMDQGDEESTKTFLKAAPKAQAGEEDSGDETPSNNEPSKNQRLGSQLSGSENSGDTIYVLSRDVGKDLVKAIEKHEATGAALHRVARECDKKFEEAHNTIIVMQEAIDKQQASLDERNNSVRRLETEIRDLMARLGNPAPSSGPSSVANPPIQEPVCISASLVQTSTGNFLTGDKIFTRILAGMPNEGLYMEKDGKIKTMYEGKLVLSSYFSSKIGEVVEHSVMVKNFEFSRTADDKLV